MFRTELTPQKPDFSLGLQDPLITVGSCFSEVIGQRLQDAKFQVMTNPFGTIFHPSVACQLISYALFNRLPDEDTFLQANGRWFSYVLHSSIHAESKKALTEKLRQLFSDVQQQLGKAKALMLTAGTAYLYVHQQKQLVVANCHKQAQREFQKELSTVEEVYNQLEFLYQSLRNTHPGLRLILTLSPVRHLKDTLPLNTVSKSVLRLAIHQLCERYPKVVYFPSYELLMDDLRDYRFYGRDLLHPGELAEEYIWQKFADTFLNEEAHRFLKEWQSIRQALQHRPFNPASDAHQQFIRKTISKLESLAYQVDVSHEIDQLKSQQL